MFFLEATNKCNTFELKMQQCKFVATKLSFQKKEKLISLDNLHFRKPYSILRYTFHHRPTFSVFFNLHTSSKNSFSL